MVGFPECAIKVFFDEEFLPRSHAIFEDTSGDFFIKIYCPIIRVNFLLGTKKPCRKHPVVMVLKKKQKKKPKNRNKIENKDLSRRHPIGKRARIML